MIEIRRPVPADAADLAAMVDELNEHEGDERGCFTAETALADVIGPDAPVSAHIASGPDGALGYAFWHFAYETAWAARGSYLADLYVRESARGQGLGDRLLRSVAAATKASGGSFIWWTAYRSDTRALAFYRRRAAEEDRVVAYAAAHMAFEALLRKSDV